MVKGACECGAITYEVGAELGPVTACHCIQCRKISGHFTAATPAPIEAVTIKGEVRGIGPVQGRSGAFARPAAAICSGRNLTGFCT